MSFLTAIPLTPPTARLVVLHGYGDHAGRYSHFMQWMADRGIACYALDFRGHGRSGGKPGAISKWDDYLDDLRRFLSIDELSDRSIPLFILGHSHGGLITIAAATRGMLNHCHGIILVSPYLALKMPVPRFKRWLAILTSTLLPSLAIKSGLHAQMLTRDQQMIEQGRGDPHCPGIATPRWFTETSKAQALLRTNAGLITLPMLMLLPGDDTVADSTVSADYFESSASKDKTILHYPEHRHELLREHGREKIFQDMAEWISVRHRSPTRSQSETHVPGPS